MLQGSGKARDPRRGQPGAGHPWAGKGPAPQGAARALVPAAPALPAQVPPVRIGGGGGRRRGSGRPAAARRPAGGSSGGLVPTSQAPGPPRLFSVPELGRQGLGRPASAGDRSCARARTPPGHRRSQPERGPGLAGRWLDSLRPVGLGVAGGHPGTPLGVASFSREAQPCSPVGTSPAGPPCGSGRAADPGPGGGERRLC